MVHPDDYDDFIALNMEVFEKTLPFYWEGRCIVNGDIKWLIAESVPRKLLDGGTVWEGVMTDITERKQFEARLKASEASMRKILDNAPIPMACNTLEAQPRTLYLNQQFIRTFGYTLEDIPTLTDWAILAYPDEDYRTETFDWWNAAVEKAVINKGNVESREFHVRCKDGAFKDVQISATILEDMLVGSLIDITERKRAEAALRAAQEELVRQEVERTRTEERQRMIHDLHDGFGSQLAIARHRLTRESVSQAEIANLLTECISDLYLVVDTLDNNQGKLVEALRALRDRIEKRLSGTPLRIDWNLRLDAAPFLSPAGIIQVLRILQEAINNTLKHARARHIRIDAHYEPCGEVTITLQDDGIGLPEKPVFGHGINSMQRRARSLEGTVRVERSEPGTTVCLRFALPEAPVDSRR